MLSKKNNFFKKLLATTEYRSLHKLEQAVKLVLEENISLGRAATVTGLSKSSVQRAVDATKDSRQVGKNGRPSSLGILEKQFFHQELASQDDASKPLTLAQAGSLV